MGKNNEHKDWVKLSNKEKSYTVRVLNYFHFRRTRIHQSWIREEVITWEILRALEIVPKKYLLKELLLYIKKKNTSLEQLIDNLIQNLEDIEIIPYPELGLKGIYAKSRSDIGLTIKDFCLWIEVKTQLTSEEKLEEQVDKQKNAPNFKINKNKGVLVLIPNSQYYRKERIYWSDLLDILKKVKKDIENEENNVLSGYLKITNELIDRIESRDSWIKNEK